MSNNATLNLCKARHLIENFFASKQYRAIATRYDKIALIFAAVHHAPSIVWLN